MKIISILSLFILFQSSLHAGQVQILKTESAIGTGYPGGFIGGFGGGMFGGVSPKPLDMASTPKITITIEDKESISCDADLVSKTYICPNDGKPVLVKSSSFGLTALGRTQENSAKIIHISHAEADGKVLYETPAFPAGMGGYGADFKPNNTKDLDRDYSTRLLSIDGFFEIYPGTSLDKRKPGSAEYEKIFQSFMVEKQQIKDDIAKIYHQTKYNVELENGQKISCARGNTRALTEEEKSYQARSGADFQCGSFKCDPVKVDGKDYEATMLYESSPGSMISGSIHLLDKDGIGPTTIIKKITSPDASAPLLDNTYYLENANKSYNKYSNSSMLPVSLKQDRDKITIYKDPGFEQVLNYYKNLCGDDKALDALMEGKKKLVSKLANLELAQLIQVLANGSLVGQFVDPTLAPELGCLYQGVYLNEEAAKNLDRLKKNIHPDSHVDQTISLDRATELFNKAAAMKDIAWKYKPDGCYARAHLMARRFEEEGVRVDKVWIKGDLYVPGTEPLIQWNFHVAPIVYVKDGKGNIQKMVIDPSLFEKPVTVEEWDNKMSKKTAKGSVVTAFPFPENSAFMERSTLSFSSSDPYLPRDTIEMTEQDKMDQAKMTMEMYKPMEPK